MTTMTLTVPDELAQRLEPVANQLPEILSLGLRAYQTNALPGFPGAADVLEFFASLPSAEEILALKPADMLVARVDELTEKSCSIGLTPAEARVAAV